MACTPVGLDHVNLLVRNAARSGEWYRDLLGLHVQDTMYHPGTSTPRAVFLSCDLGHAHDIAVFEIGEDAAPQGERQVGLSHVAWRMGSLDDLAEMYHRLRARQIPIRVRDHTVSIGIYFSDPDGNGLEVYYELPRSAWNRDMPFSGEGGKGRFPGPWDAELREVAAARA